MFSALASACRYWTQAMCSGYDCWTVAGFLCIWKNILVRCLKHNHDKLWFMKCAIRKEIIWFSLDLIVNRMGRATIWNGRCLFEWINRISNLTAQIKLLNDLNPKQLVFKAVWGFFDIRIGYFAVRPPVAYRGGLQSLGRLRKNTLRVALKQLPVTGL